VASDAETNTYLEDQYGEELPSPDHPFDPDDIPGFATGDWPLWPKQAMLRWLPTSVQALGRVEESLMNGTFLHLDEDQSDEVVARLSAYRLECVTDTQDLVLGSCGSWRYS
jgi:hypothetical protein